MTAADGVPLSGGRQVLPAFHLRPARGWINDPNGMVFRGGAWHVFYQHNPSGPFHRAIQWGHASSADLLTWTHHPVAFGPTPAGPDSFGCWSGVAVTGLERPAVVYSGVVDATCASTVCLRWGSDDLDSWSGPQVVATTPTDAGIAVMRDPFVFTWAGHRWALVGAGADDGTPRVLIFGCDDIERWAYRGVFLDGRDPILTQGAPANIFECPQLVPPSGGEPGLVIVSLWQEGTLASVAGVVGEIEDAGGVPVFRPVLVEAIDGGEVFYAPQIADDPGRAALMLGWLREGDLDPATHEVAGCLSLPRRVSVRGGRVHVELDDAVNRLPLGAAEPLSAGTHELPAHGVLRLRSGDAVLTGSGTEPAATVGVPLTGPATVYLDGAVAEVTGGRVPASYRSNGSGWQLRLGAGADADVRLMREPPSRVR